MNVTESQLGSENEWTVDQVISKLHWLERVKTRLLVLGIFYSITAVRSKINRQISDRGHDSHTSYSYVLSRFPCCVGRTELGPQAHIYELVHQIFLQFNFTETYFFGSAHSGS
jgi:hypothetical protein